MKIKKQLINLSLIAVFLTTLAGCAQDNIKAPCANYGKWCSKTPINSWNYKN
tara:strand:+ start:110 stop:265 length:156 start_codon:yes stop_codon:yes gene_type:complete